MCSFILVLKFFGEEDAQRFFVDCFAEAVADKEAQQGKTDAEYYLVQVKHLDF